jgi:hypothetical protein
LKITFHVDTSFPFTPILITLEKTNAEFAFSIEVTFFKGRASYHNKLVCAQIKKIKNEEWHTLTTLPREFEAKQR